MNPIKDIFAGLFKSAEGILDTTITNKEELQQVKNDLQKILNEAEINAQQQVTDRWNADMQFGNKLSKTIRPAVLIFLTLSFVVISCFDGNVGDFSINKDFVPVYEMLLLSVYGAYFVGRTIEKTKHSE